MKSSIPIILSVGMLILCSFAEGLGNYRCGGCKEKKGETEFNDSPELTGRVQRRRMFQAQERERLPRRTSICIAARKLGCDCKKK